MIHFAYLITLVIPIFGMVMIDRRYKLAFFDDARRAAIVLASSVSVFVLWDLAGIALGIFRKGESDLALDFTILPELPLEELLFLFLLTYLSLLAYVYFSRKRAA